MAEEKTNEFVEADAKRKIDNFFKTLQFRLGVLRAYKHDLDVYLADDFNAFDYIKPDENRLSDIIMDLLNPKGKHGQGDVFLKEFLKIVEKPEPHSTQTVEMVREDPTSYIKKSQRRIDITIDFDKHEGIGIENKPWAGEQEDQVKDYQEHLEKKYKDNFVLVYLSGAGNEPESIKEGEKEILERQGKLKVLAYPVGFKNWLESCYKECKAEKIRWFLKDFIEYTERNFRIE